MNPQPDPTPDESAAAVTAFLAARDEYRASLRPGAPYAISDVITAAIHTANIEVNQGATSFELDTTELRESHLRALLRALGEALGPLREREREYDLHRVTMVAASDGTVRPQHVEHIPACDALRYGVQCHFDHLVVDQGRGWPQEPGVYVAYVNPIREPCLRYDRIGSAPGEASPAIPDRETEATP